MFRPSSLQGHMPYNVYTNGIIHKKYFRLDGLQPVDHVDGAGVL